MIKAFIHPKPQSLACPLQVSFHSWCELLTQILQASWNPLGKLKLCILKAQKDSEKETSSRGEPIESVVYKALTLDRPSANSPRPCAPSATTWFIFTCSVPPLEWKFEEEADFIFIHSVAQSQAQALGDTLHCLHEEYSIC